MLSPFLFRNFISFIITAGETLLNHIHIKRNFDGSKHVECLSEV